MVPDVQNNQRLSHYVTVLEKLIESTLKSTKRMLHTMNVFMYVFKMRVESIVSDLKKKTWNLQQEQIQAEEAAAQEALEMENFLAERAD